LAVSLSVIALQWSAQQAKNNCQSSPFSTGGKVEDQALLELPIAHEVDEGKGWRLMIEMGSSCLG
jgi:hypothetical protein